MPFFRVFLRTLGFLFGILVFIIIINIGLIFLQSGDDEFIYLKGNEKSKNIITILDLNGPIINNYNEFLTNNFIEIIVPEIVKNNLIKISKLNSKILIIKINSPGGTITPTHTLEKILNNFKIILKT